MVSYIQNNKITSIEGVRNLVDLAYEYHLEEDEVFILLRGLESETDHLPIYNHNNTLHLHKDYIEKIKNEEKLYLGDIQKLCNDILEKYS